MYFVILLREFFVGDMKIWQAMQPSRDTVLEQAAHHDDDTAEFGFSAISSPTEIQLALLRWPLI